jgi:hypothetical protein
MRAAARCRVAQTTTSDLQRRDSNVSFQAARSLTSTADIGAQLPLMVCNA